MKARTLEEVLKNKLNAPLSRITIVTGARQTGKTTLISQTCEDYHYISLDDPVLRPLITGQTADQLIAENDHLIIDEVQKAPTLFDTIKAAHDQHENSRFILSGSSQINLQKNISESLAGRVSILELFPLTLPEIQTQQWTDRITPSPLVQYLEEDIKIEAIRSTIPQGLPHWTQINSTLNQYLRFGGMPALYKAPATPEEKYDWLRNYVRTYLNRDLSDLARLNDLEPFIKAQIAAAELSGNLMNYTHIAELASIATKTAKNFMGYLELSYQMFILSPWFANRQKRLVRSPKLHFIDPGILRILTDQFGELNGNAFESAVVGEIYKQIKARPLNIRFHHLRTQDGREIDLLLETPEGYIPIEIKKARKLRHTDARHLRQINTILDKPLLHAFVFSNDPRIQTLTDDITAVPIAFMLGAGLP